LFQSDVNESTSKELSTGAKIKKNLNTFDDKVMKTSIPIGSLEELNSFVCATNADWKHHTLYIEHPRRSRVLIPANEYDTFIFWEIISDLQKYITQAFAVSELIIGYVKSKSFEAVFDAGDHTVGTQELNFGATLNCQLEQSILQHIKNTDEPQNKQSNDTDNRWIDLFPQLKQAVDCGTSWYEQVNKIEIQLQSKLLKNNSTKCHNEFELYIFYKKKPKKGK
jgi:hypothetical protein